MVCDEYPGGMVGRTNAVAAWLLEGPPGASLPQPVISSGNALMERQTSAIVYLFRMGDLMGRDMVTAGPGWGYRSEHLDVSSMRMGRFHNSNASTPTHDQSANRNDTTIIPLSPKRTKVLRGQIDTKDLQQTIFFL